MVNIPTQTTILGAIVAQEACKYIGKFLPIANQWFSMEIADLYPSDSIVLTNTGKEKGRYGDFIKLYGLEIHKKLRNLKILLAGAGALGSEILKQFALLGVGTGKKGKITVSDNDTISRSNLNRTLLFLEDDIGLLKSQRATEKCLNFNQDLNFSWSKDCITMENEHKFTDTFWDNLDLCVSAVDTFEGRIYLNNKCIFHCKPFFEGGTEGFICSTNSIIPFETEPLPEDYGSEHQNKEETPSCTVKNFPYKFQHAVQWARELFESIFVVPYSEIPDSSITEANHSLPKDTHEFSVNLFEVISQCYFFLTS